MTDWTATPAVKTKDVWAKHFAAVVWAKGLKDDLTDAGLRGPCVYCSGVARDSIHKNGHLFMAKAEVN